MGVCNFRNRGTYMNTTLVRPKLWIFRITTLLRPKKDTLTLQSISKVRCQKVPKTLIYRWGLKYCTEAFKKVQSTFFKHMKSMLLSRLLYFLDELLDAPLFISAHTFSMFVKSFKFWKGSINWNFERVGRSG